VLSPQERAAAAERAERQFQRMLSQAQDAQHRQAVAAHPDGSGSAATQPASALQLTLNEDELNAFFEKWDNAFGWSRRYDRYINDPQIVLHDHHIILAANVKEMGLLVSVHFEPALENGKLSLRVVNVLGGQLPLPQAMWGGYRQKLLHSLKEKIPQWQAGAHIGPDGANSDAVYTAMAQMLAHVLNDEPAEPFIFVPYSVQHSNWYLPVRLTDVAIENKTLTLTGDPVPPGERAGLMERIMAPAVAGDGSS
jgi:hypothetical protein